MALLDYHGIATDGTLLMAVLVVSGIGGASLVYGRVLVRCDGVSRSAHADSGGGGGIVSDD